MKKMKVEEFVRRLKDKMVQTPEIQVVFFIGAGCSVSSGIPTAKELVKQWLPRLKSLRVGDDEDFHTWIRTEFPKYTDSNAAQYYGPVIEELFPTTAERQKEIERLTQGIDPGFAYTVLAKLMGSEKYGRHCNTVITTNFDDLIADALYLHTSKKPLVIVHDSLFGFVKTYRSLPLIIKLHGDARLAPKNTDRETEDLTADVKKVLTNLLTETCLVFVGYGGNDKSIVNIFNNLPKSSISGGVFWVSSHQPTGKMREWLESREDSWWVEHGDFDELMLLTRSEFNLDHPDMKRFDSLYKKYMDTYKALSAKVDIKKNIGEKRILEEAIRKADSEFPNDWGVINAASKLESTDPTKADITYQQGLEKFPKSGILLTAYATFLHVVGKDYDKAEEYYKKALEIDPLLFVSYGNYALLLDDIRKDYDKAEEYYKKALEINPRDAKVMDNYANLLYEIRKDYDKAEEYYKKALEIDPLNAINANNYVIFLKRAKKDYDTAEEYYKNALGIFPRSVDVLTGYADLLHHMRKDYDKAEVYYKKALEANPRDANSLANYGGFLLGKKRYGQGLRLVHKAIQLGRKDKKTSPSVFVECWYYLHAHAKGKKLRTAGLTELKTILKAGKRTHDWVFEDNISTATRDGYPNPEFLKTLADVCNGLDSLEKLDNFREWSQIG
jgi:Tfp pilus assembly protein PilF/NAD-dependent SIR2 family protein deacetylase